MSTQERPRQKDESGAGSKIGLATKVVHCEDWAAACADSNVV